MRAMAGAAVLSKVVAQRLGVQAEQIGQAQPPLGGDYKAELAAAVPDLQKLAAATEAKLSSGIMPITALNRCTASLATLPAVAQYHPDVKLVWLDAHADCNTPATSTSGYLGGMVVNSKTSSLSEFEQKALLRGS